MDPRILNELCRAWREQNTARITEARDESAKDANAHLDGQQTAREQCAQDLESLLGIFGRLDRDDAQRSG